MNLDEQLKLYQKERRIEPREECIQRTIEASRECFFRSEAEKMLPYHSFLYIQLRMIQKRWWVFQALILAALWAVLPLTDDSLYASRSMSVAAVLFIILIVPELWKNRTNQCMEIEAAAYYSLRQVYAARMLLFGLADILMITVFCGAASVSLRMSLLELLVQFLFPMVVTACICFGILCGRHFFNEAAAIGMCIIWSALWWFILLDEQLYTAALIPVWGVLTGMAVLCLGVLIYQSVRRCNQIWEVNFDGIEHESSYEKIR